MMQEQTIISDDLFAIIGRSTGNIYLRSVELGLQLVITPSEVRPLYDFLEKYIRQLEVES